MQFMRSLLKAVPVEIAPIAAITADGDSSGYVDTQKYDGTGLFIMHSLAASSGDTNDVTIVECDTSNGTYTAVTGAAFTQITDASSGAALAQVVAVDLTKCKRYLKAHDDVGGGSISITRGIVFLGIEKGV